MEEESMDFSDDPLERQQIWSSRVVKVSSYGKDLTPSKKIPMGSNPLEEETLEVDRKMVKDLSGGGVGGDVMSSHQLSEQDRDKSGGSQCIVDVMLR
jgi:hypothetical protein